MVRQGAMIAAVLTLAALPWMAAFLDLIVAASTNGLFLGGVASQV
jgi:hypothetical protein